MVKIAGQEEKELRQRLQDREKRIDLVTTMSKQEKEKLYSEMQQDHQKVLAFEVGSTGEENEKWFQLRQAIETQQQQAQEKEDLLYSREVKNLKPPQTVLKNTVLAFLVGGLICLTGQLILGFFQSGGLPQKEASAATSAVLVFTGALLTGLGLYDEIGRYAGAGSIVPITGFANSVASSALEFKREGYVYGVGARIFTVAGPVIVYGTVVSVFVGLVYYFMK